MDHGNDSKVDRGQEVESMGPDWQLDAKTQELTCRGSHWPQREKFEETERQTDTDLRDQLKKKNACSGGWAGGSVVKHVPCACKALGLILSNTQK
jgi:hypothetical protein